MTHAKHALPQVLRSIALLSLIGASLAACTPKDQAELKDVGQSTANEARKSAAKLSVKIDQGVDKARVAGAAAARAAGSALDDTAITAETKAALAHDAEISAGRVSVSTKAGVVELSGSVPTDAARSRAASIARSAKGAKRVENRVIVAAAPNDAK